ncbi:MAG: outer membrane beta-barrel protein, partial [Campylobacterota bacterium]|nr:outer membrane beta-barrel protein [Campylobacterota bacterium]
MKKIALSLLTMIAMGDSIAKADDAGIYLGAGYALTMVDFTVETGYFELPGFDASTDSVLFLAGYDLNEYIGIEGRYYWNVTSIAIDYYDKYGLLDEYTAESFAVYLKPQYSFDPISIYALIGITMNDYTLLVSSESDALFSWGLGAKFRLTDSFSVFADYTDLGESENL